MSLRELKALTEGKSKKPSARTQLRSRAGTVMSHDEEAEVQAQQTMEQLETKLAAALKEVGGNEEELETELESALSSTERYRAQVELQEKELAEERIRTELTKLRALEGLRYEHQKLLETEKQHMRRECQMLETWVSDLKDSLAVEKEHLLGRIAELEVTQQKASHTRMSLETSHTRTPGESEVSDSDMVDRGGDDRTEALNSSGVTDGLENGMSRHMVEVTESLDTGNVTDSSTGHVSGSGILEIGMSGVSCVEPTF